MAARHAGIAPTKCTARARFHGLGLERERERRSRDDVLSRHKSSRGFEKVRGTALINGTSRVGSGADNQFRPSEFFRDPRAKESQRNSFDKRNVHFTRHVVFTCNMRQTDCLARRCMPGPPGNSLKIDTTHHVSTFREERLCIKNGYYFHKLL